MTRMRSIRPETAVPAASAGRGIGSAGPGATSPGAPETGALPERAQPWARAMLAAFLVTLLFPIFLNLGGLRLSPYRIVLLMGFLPLVAAWAGGMAGRIRAVDLLLLSYCLWVFVGYLQNHPPGRALEAWGITFVETFGAYLLARLAIRSAEDMVFFIRVFCAVVLVMSVFTFLESTARLMILDDVFGGLFDMRKIVDEEERLGLRRAQGPVDHPILYGVFCSMGFALSWYGLGWRPDGRKGATAWPAAVVWATFWSLSAGAWLAVAMQGALIAWDRIMAGMKGRWWLLLGLFVGMYVFLELASNRGALGIILGTLTFNQHNAAYRLLIWEYAWPEAVRLWKFGGGMDYDWARAPGMGATIDTMWLVVGVRSGLIALFGLGLVFVLALRDLIGARLADPRLDEMRKALAFVILGLVMAVFTVHLWNAAFTMMMVVLGAGAWLSDSSGAVSPGAQPASGPASGPATGPRTRRAVLGDRQAAAARPGAVHAQDMAGDGVPGPEPAASRAAARAADRKAGRETGPASGPATPTPATPTPATPTPATPTPATPTPATPTPSPAPPRRRTVL